MAEPKISKPNKNTMMFKIVSITQISKNIKRMIFLDTSRTLKKVHESGYLKLQLADNDGTKVRSYTIREVDENLHHVMIDFVCHAVTNGLHKGPALTWAMQANVDDTIMVIGPGAGKLADPELDWFFIVGDMTALPAIAVNLKKLPKHAKGYAIIEVADASDIQNLKKPEHIDIQWLINADPTDSAKQLLTQVKKNLWLAGTPYVWVATEFDSARALRQYFRDNHNITKNRYISSYWKLGETDEGNKRAKKRDGGF